MDIPAIHLRSQIDSVLTAWGFGAADVAATADALVWADLRAIDSHGIALLLLYEQFLNQGSLIVRPEVAVIRDRAATAVVDGGSGLGHRPACLAADLAAEKAQAFGLGAVAVRNSNHFGAAGFYAARMAEKGLLGIVTSSVHLPAIVPTFGTVPMLGTNPIALAAPTARNRPFVLDMATSTAAIGKLRLAKRAGRQLPAGWALDTQGRPETDPDAALAVKRLTPLGGSRELGGHKGYGLATLVEILSTTLSGAAFAPLRPKDNARLDVGHFLMAIDPDAFRETGDFEDDLDDLIDAMRASPPAEAGQPVMVAGDPEHAAHDERSTHGIPLNDSLLNDLKALAERCGAPFHLAEEVP